MTALSELTPAQEVLSFEPEAVQPEQMTMEAALAPKGVSS